MTKEYTFTIAFLVSVWAFTTWLPFFIRKDLHSSLNWRAGIYITTGIMCGLASWGFADLIHMYVAVG